MCRVTAKAISEGLVIGWFQGRMEWGPRALGNRSIVCDPRRADMKDILNLKIKRRGILPPVCAVDLAGSTSEHWFEEDDDVPFMMQVYQIRAEKRALIPGRDPCRRLRPPANRLSRDEPALLHADRGLPRSPTCPWCSTLRSTKTNPSSAARRRRSIVFCGRRWTCSSSMIG